MSPEFAPTPSDLIAHPANPAQLALALAAGHLTEAAISAHRYRDQHDVANHLGVSKARVNRLVLLTTLAPDIQEQLLDLERGAYLGDLSERTVRVLVAGHGDWAIQRWWWSLLAQPFEPDWLVHGLPARTAFPSGRGCRRCDRALGDLPLRELADLVARRPGRHEVSASREALLTALADGGAGTPPMSTAVRLTLAKPASELAVDFERLHGHRPPSHHPDYLRRRVSWAVQAGKSGGLPKPISGKVMEFKEHLPERWQGAFAGVARVHVTRVHRVARTAER